MARRPAATDALLALALGVEMQVELFFVDAPPHDVLLARGVLVAEAVAVAARRRAPVLAAAVTLAVVTALERLNTGIDANLVGPFFAALIVAYSVGAHT